MELREAHGGDEKLVNFLIEGNFILLLFVKPPTFKDNELAQGGALITKTTLLHAVIVSNATEQSKCTDALSVVWENSSSNTDGFMLNDEFHCNF